MEKSYPAYREKFSAVTKETMKVFSLSEKVLVMLCSYMGQKLSRSPRSRLSTYKRDLSVPGRTFRLIWTKCITFHIDFITRRDFACKLVECFLANRDNFSYLVHINRSQFWYYIKPYLYKTWFHLPASRYLRSLQTNTVVFESLVPCSSNLNCLRRTLSDIRLQSSLTTLLQQSLLYIYLPFATKSFTPCDLEALSSDIVFSSISARFEVQTTSPVFSMSALSLRLYVYIASLVLQ
jgi:hypothetical protein